MPERKEAIPWNEIKRQAREAHYRTLGTPGLSPGEAIDLAKTSPPRSTQQSSGGVRGSAPTASAATLTDRFATVAAPDPDSPATSATDTALPAISPVSLSSLTRVTRTPPSSNDHTVWSATPLGFVESGRRLTTDDLKCLPTPVQASLHALAIGRSEPPEAVAEQIIAWFVEEEDERAEGRCDDAVIFYCEQMLLR